MQNLSYWAITKWFIKMIRATNKNTFVLKNEWIMLDGQFHRAYQNYSKECNFSYFIRLLEYLGKFQSSYETNKSMKNIMRLILEEVIMLNRHMLDGQLYLFFNTEKISLNWRLDSTITDEVFLIFIVIPL